MAAEQAKQFIEQAVQSLQGGQVYQALELADQAIAQDPASDEAYVLCGVALSHCNQPQAANEAFESALELNPENSKAYYNYAVHLYTLGQKAEALRMANHATVVDPGYAAARDMVNRIEVESGIRVEDQAPLAVPGPKSPLGTRAGYEEMQVHTLPFVQNLGAAWVVIGWIVAFGSLLNFFATVVAITSVGGEILKLTSAAGFGLPLTAILYLAGAAWTILDVLDQRGNFLWVVSQSLCGLFSGSFISLPLYILTGRQKF